MLDLAQVDPRFLALKYSDHPESAFVYQGLTFKVHTNGNLATIKFVIDLKGDLQVRINPKFTWGLIQNTVAHYYDWCRREQMRRYAQFDLTSLKAQRERTLQENDLIYLWGLPYLLHINAYCGQDDEVKIKSRPQQVTPVLVPKGCSRYSDKFYYLLHNGYLHRFALENLPIINQEQWLLPRKCLVGNPHEFIRYPLASKALLDPKLRNIYDRTRPQGNFFLERMGYTLQLITRHAQQHQFYGSRYLSHPQRLLVEQMIEPLAARSNPDFVVRRHHERMVAKCETLTSDYWKAIVSGPLTYKDTRPHFPINPYLAYDLTTVRAHDPNFSAHFSLGIIDNLKDQRLVRTNVLPIELLWRGHGSSEQRRQEVYAAQEHGAYVAFYPDQANYAGLNLETLSAEYQRQVKFYRTGELDLSVTQQRRQFQAEQVSLAAIEQAARDYSLMAPPGAPDPTPTPTPHPEPFSPQLLLSRPRMAFQVASLNTTNRRPLAPPMDSPKEPSTEPPLPPLIESPLEYLSPQNFAVTKPDDSNFSLGELEMTLCDSTGHEIDPALALMALLPDNPDQSNCLEAMAQNLAVNELKTSYLRMVATDLLAQHVARGNLSYAHDTLATPGGLEINIKGKVTPDKVRRALQKFLAQEVSTKASHFLEQVHSYYDEIYLAAAHHIALPALRWYQRPVRSKAMSPLGLCKAEGGLPEIRLNQMLAHFPYNVMTSVASHELCHLGCFNHGPAFYHLLSALNPDANTISDNIAKLGILPL